MQNKETQMQTIKKVFHRLGKYRIYLILSLILAFITVALTLYIPNCPVWQLIK